MSFTIENIREARERIAPYIARTPLLRLQNLDSYLGCQVYVKAECMQTTGAFKLRGAMNKMLSLTPEQLKNGVVASSSGNHGRAVAYAARMLGTKATIVMPNSAPAMKLNAIKALGAEIVMCEPSERHAAADRICEETGAVLVPPFNDPAIMAGQGTAGLEIAEDCPDVDVVITPLSGGGLLSGVATAVRTLCPNARVYGAEPAPLPRYTVSLAEGKAVTVPQKPTIADALIGQTPGSHCFPVVQQHVAGTLPVDDAYTLKAMKLLLTEGKLLGEPAACIGMGAVLQGLLPVKPEEKVCFLVSGGNVGFEQLRVLDDVTL
ncbi:threonine ammonia-lyase [Dysosmobacter sp.]|uniref:threonine ammonia-lyase n=1 Tax=Dysosmobacter sp. TaxID=2591382 RepID=UPI002A879D0C|nr:threonine/serine dehydratase [Dysosmobacter sp.]MDY3280920.1 threonine/serine dehydratase [Dysosmobacter sp.]